MNKKQKKTFIFMLGGIVLLIILCFCLKPQSKSYAAYSSKSTVTSQFKPSSSETTTAGNDLSAASGLTINESQLDNLGKPKHEIEITVDELIKAIDKTLKEKNVSLLSDQLPEVDDYKDGSMGDVNENLYNLGDGILLSIYSDKENSKITGMQFFINIPNTTKDSLKYYALCVDATIKYLDGKNADEIEKALDLSNIETKEFKSADTDKYHFFYSVQEGTDVLMIELNK